jgi:hypothetical protein
VESILATDLGKVLVGANTTGFQGFGGQLLILVGDQMHAERELVDTSLLTAQVKDTDLKGQHRLSTRTKGGYGPLSRGHHGCSGTWGMACSCLQGISLALGKKGHGGGRMDGYSSDNNEQDDEP